MQLREKSKSAAPKPPSQTEASDAEYSVVSQDWINKKKKVVAPEPNLDDVDTVPPPLPPRSELADELEEDKVDEDMYDIPVVPKDVVKVQASDKSMSSSSVTIDNDLYQSSGATKDNDLSPKIKKPPGSPLVRKTASLDEADTTYDVIGEVPAKKAMTLPATTNRDRSASPEYAVVQQSPKKTHHKPDITIPASKSPRSSPLMPRAVREYDYISVAAAKEAATKIVVSDTADEYDRPVTARQHELKVNSPPSPQLSNYAKLQDAKTSKKGNKNKQQWDLPKKSGKPQKAGKKSRSVSIEDPHSPSSSEQSDTVDKAIKELKKGLEEPSARSDKSQSLDLSTVLEPSVDLALDWDDSDLEKNRDSASAVQQQWVKKHQNILVQRSYEDVDLPSNGTSSPSLPDKLRHGWSPRGLEKDDGETLPPGWSKIVGEDGVYYWHVKSGKTQWKPPKEEDAPNKVNNI